jgi:hypothetical protein|tara:strand:+ start:253 stop:558 length:306 start_codon:yes stop_codon:yes gene_type:complete
MRMSYKFGKDVKKKKTVKVRDINKDGKKEGWEVARAKGMAKGMGARLKFRTGGDTHVTKEGKTAKKGLWYNIAMKRKRGEKMRKKGDKGAPTAKAIKKSQG